MGGYQQTMVGSDSFDGLGVGAPGFFGGLPVIAPGQALYGVLAVDDLAGAVGSSLSRGHHRATEATGWETG